MEQKRLDVIVAEKLDISRSAAAKLIEQKKVRASSKIIEKPSKKFTLDANLEIDFSKNIKYPKLKIPVIYEDKDCVVIDKPQGVLSHSKGQFNPEPTVATWLKTKTIGFGENDQRAGIVHRLDRGTSGVMILAKNFQSLKFLQKQFSARKTKKVYAALTSEKLEPKSAVVDIPIARKNTDPKKFMVSHAGKPAQTEYKILKRILSNDKQFFLVELKPKTGRTHQLRVHLKHMNAGIVGDLLYGGVPAGRLYLHATRLEITLPNSKRKIFASPLPKGFLKPKILKA